MKLSAKVQCELLDQFAKAMSDGYVSAPPEPQREPVKFEAGQVVRFTSVGTASGDPIMVTRVTPRHLHGYDLGDRTGLYLLDIEGHQAFADIVSPAPRHGDTWSNGESVARIELCAHGDTSLRIVSEGEPFVGDVVAVARRLWEGGYRRVERSTASELRETMKDAAVQMTRLILGSEEAEKLRAAQRAPLPRAGDVYEHADGTVVELRERDGQLYTEVLQSLITYPTLLEANDASMLAEMLREHGYRKVGEVPTDREREQIRREVEWEAVAERTGQIRDALARAAAAGVKTLVADVRDRDRPRRGRIEAVYRDTGWVSIMWNGSSALDHYGFDNVADLIRDDRWRIVTPDVRPLASLASAVAAIFATPDRETSRRYVDLAVRALRGEPFERAVQAALVGVCDIANLSPAEIAACIVALRHWEARRPFDRDLVNLKVRTNDWVRGGPWNRLQIECNGVLTSALGYAPKWDYDRIYFVYERARTS